MTMMRSQTPWPVRSPLRAATAAAGLGRPWFRFLLFASIFPVFVSAGAAQTISGKTRSPHGNLSLACETCHTSTSWRPIRPNPDFNHNETRYPLRGMHQSVGCRQCHAKMIFTDVGATCAECHADIHKRQFGGKCEECHTVRGWLVSLQSVKQHSNRFPLLGAHAAVDCASCHKNAAAGTFVGLSTDCASCHLDRYRNNGAFDHAAANLPLKCDICHRMDSWKGARFDHTQFTNFALTGAHSTLDCSSCHTGKNFAGTPANCYGCHVKDFNGTSDPNHVKAGFPHECSTCHSMSSWAGAKFDHAARTGFSLTGAHGKLACASCHAGGRYAGTPQDCYGCHLANFESAKNPDHMKLGFPTSCAACHTTTGWQGAKFDHNLTRFALSGAHASVGCKSCHMSENYSAVSSSCASCHLQAYNGTKSPNHVAAGFPQDCTVCHTTVQWKGAKFDHNSTTRFALTGAHVTVACADCHKNNVFKGLPSTCVSCHLADFNNTKNPNHAAAGFPQDCTVCHTSVQWKGAKFDHNTSTRFQLTGAHVTVACADCHKNSVFSGLASSCISCHLAEFNRTTNPNHAAAGFSQDCSICHTTAQWKGARFDHQKTKFPLTGAHSSVECKTCHTNNQFAGLNAACISCHLADFNNTKSPNHVAAGFPQDCTVCHTSVQWKGAKFDHNTSTRFQLTGAHVTVACADCHKNNVFKGLPSTCVSCHLADFNNTKSPNHVAAGFPQDCSVCHTSIQWKGAKFDHNASTRFQLTGAHVTVACADCHKNNVFKGLPSTCVSCHLADFNNTKSPNHAAAGFPQDCTLCHTTARWAGAVFDHSKTGFLLTGAHQKALCQQCHVNNVFAGTARQCSGCHISQFNATTNPKHAAAGFPTDCSLCHTTTAWTPASFNHNTATKFALTGAHTAAKCSDCHARGVYAGLNTACVNCHLNRFNATTNPNHAAAGFPTDCAVCHTTTAWTPASFNHTQTRFPLTGAHTAVLCVRCHIGGKFAGTPTDCWSCHQSVFNATTNPNHIAAGFPHDCTVCHTTTGWAGARFNHTRFPIYSGSHAGKWTSCQDCHTNSSNYTIFSCTNCHQHEKTTTDAKHRQVNNYVYNSANCYACHPQGRSG
jgi:hypothetical protein